jgi:vacuolar protein sorting-associated protein 13A/C
MTGIAINDCIDTVDSITKQLVAHYKRTCVNQFYKIFGSLNIIGNPISLFRNISTGVKDLKEKPAQGFVNGPLEFGIGIVQGTGSLLAHSIGGAFSSISKVTGTFSTGLATLSFDKDF